ncbi:MAG: hypothetical protein B9S33_04570 [Pedosphaera sp. Tous-C6FEB]|nr:MAG: hypothetical protein B9S33_04570 [Pedosphaera sp. Tous-C6FEB]
MPTGPTRLILIRSGCYDYAEVELTGTLQIVGPNNIGKTTLIKTLQFLYIDDRRHMDFGSYTPEQTREFYFPGQYSYILFECLGATGQCVIGWRGQSKTTGGEPERFCYEGPFDAADFHDERGQVREPRDVSARLALKQLRVLKGAQEHRELLLPPAGGDTRGLGIIALREPDKFHHFRETLKNLLALEAITQQQMRHRLLMLADIPPDRTALDARALFGDDYDRIRQRREQLVRFKKNQPLVEKLVNKFTERETVRGELIWRWTDLKGKQQRFEQEHEAMLEKLRAEKTAQENRLTVLDTELKDRRAEVTEFSVEQGKATQPLDALGKLDKEFADFVEELERAALANLQADIRSLENQLASAEGQSRQAAQTKLDHYGSLVRQKEQTIARFDKLAITALRKHFSDDELNVAFRLLNPGLLELPVGGDGIVVTRERETLAAIRALLGRVSDGSYRDANLTIPIASGRVPLVGLENVETAREHLKDYADTLKRWTGIMAAIEQKEALEVQLKAKREERDGAKDASGREIREGKLKRLVRFEEYQKSKAEEPRLRAELKKITATIATATERIEVLTKQSKVAEKAKAEAQGAVLKAEDEYGKVIGNYDQCVFPEFVAKAVVADGIPNDFDAAIALFLRQQEKQEKLSDEIAGLLAETERWFGEEFRGEDEHETIARLRAELEALVEKEDALARDWNAHLHGLKATFDLVLRNLGHVTSAANDLTRAFAKVQVSNLKTIKLEVVEQSDLVSWIRKLAQAEQPGLFDDDTSLSGTLRNFRAKLEGNSVIRFTELFTLGVTVTGADDRRRTYPNLQQIESDGTTITIKVLFNLLLLKNQLRRDDCAVPFFLDETLKLDPANRHAILSTARQLGFIAIVAAPEPVSEVDALYFVQPQRGRIILRNKHRVGVRRAASAAP